LHPQLKIQRTRPDLWIRFHDFILDTVAVGPANKNTIAALDLSTRLETTAADAFNFAFQRLVNGVAPNNPLSSFPLAAEVSRGVG
jgi:hypothetical protein